METGTPRENVVSYLARYANRVVIANDRLITIEDGEVYFSYKDYRDDNRRKVYHLLGVAFLLPSMQHILPPGFHNKRRHSFWVYHVRTENLARIREQLGVPPVEVHHEEVENGDEALAEGPPGTVRSARARWSTWVARIAPRRAA